MKIRIFEKGFNYSQDGEGNRLVYHLQGCNLRCPWCANPEGMPFVPPIFVEEKYLIESVCPHGAIKGKTINRGICEGCGARECVSKFINKGTVVKCAEYKVDDVVAEAVKCSPMFFGGGGVTLTGGEPTMQFEAVFELLKKLKAAGIDTAIETNGTSPRLPELYPFIDRLMMDYKHSDSEILKRVTGEGNETVERNIRAAAEARKTANIRIPLIGGFNADDGNLNGALEFFKSLDTDYITVEFLRYHEYGKMKWKQCGFEYRMDEKAYISEETYKKFADTFKAKGINVINT